eukprot:TRINITY_DN7517_c0_g1_i1.p1 TRINITY_DN7517_c0_g1~~TRINITY_DN7517_c0_g1_i1.p1  ORF type:complete len:404 (+),score=59.64 TRINITY_DN7517_c0_g1_i1:95-1306(+)
MSKHDNPKASRISDIWNRTEKKLVLCIENATGVKWMKTNELLHSNAKEPLELCCRIVFTGTSDKEIKQKKTNPAVVREGECSWKELVFLDLDGIDPGMEITLEVIENVNGLTMKKTPLIGSARLIKISQLVPEIVVSNKAVLVKTKGKKGSKNYIERETGILSVVMYLSESVETIGRPPDNQFFYYGPFREALKTGDLLLYNEVGLLSTMCKLSCKSIHNRAGLVLKMPNKYTQSEELFVFEVTRNSEGYADAWDEKSHSGLNIFRLWERVHHVPGHDVFWCPLGKPLSFDATSNLIDWIHKVHSAKIDVTSYYQPISKTCVNFLLTFGLDIEKEKSVQIREDLREFQSTDILVEALRIGGLRVPQGQVYVEDLIKLDAYLEPVPFRSSTKLAGKQEMIWEKE